MTRHASPSHPPAISAGRADRPEIVDAAKKHALAQYKALLQTLRPDQLLQQEQRQAHNGLLELADLAAAEIERRRARQHPQ